MTMTDDPDFLDELLTRYLDGDATDAEVARIESDVALMARTRQLQAAIDLVAAPSPIPTDDLDRIRAVAIAQGTTSPVVSDLDARRAHRQTVRNRVLAAVAVFVFLGVGFAAIQSGEQDLDTAGSSDDASDDSGDDMATDDAMALSGGDDAADTDAAESEMADEDAAAADRAEGDIAEEAASDDMADSAESAPIAPDVLPDDLGAVANITELVEQLNTRKATADAEGAFAPAEPNALDSLCDELVVVLDQTMPSGVASIEIAAVNVAGLDQQVVLATGFDGSVVGLLTADDGCAVLEVLEIDAG